jgi:hypothetical protein
VPHYAVGAFSRNGGDVAVGVEARNAVRVPTVVERVRPTPRMRGASTRFSRAAVRTRMSARFCSWTQRIVVTPSHGASCARDSQQCDVAG